MQESINVVKGGFEVLVLVLEVTYFFIFIVVAFEALNCKLTRPALNFYPRTIPVLNMYVWSYFRLSEHNNAKLLTVCPSPSNKSKRNKKPKISRSAAYCHWSTLRSPPPYLHPPKKKRNPI